MKTHLTTSLLALTLVLFSTSSLANDVEGHIETIDTDNESFVVQGIQFFVTPSTVYDDGPQSLFDLAEGQKVEVDFEYRDGKHYAIEVELEDQSSTDDQRSTGL